MLFEDMDEMPIPADPAPTGLEELDRIQSLEAQVLALHALVHMLIERDAESSDLSAERYVNSHGAELFGRMMIAPTHKSEDGKVEQCAETIASNLLERVGREKQAREAH